MGDEIETRIQFFEELLTVPPNAYVVYYVPPIYKMQTCSTNLPEYVPYVEWGVVLEVHPQLGTAIIQKYTLWDFNLYDGVPKWKYKPSPEWKKLPKNWNYAWTPPELRPVHDEEEGRAFEEFLTHAAYTNPDDLMHAVKRRWFVPLDCMEWRLDYDIDKKNYRIRAGYDMNSRELTRYSERLDCLYTNYDEAMIQARGAVADHLAKQEMEFRADVANDIAGLLLKVPEQHHQEVEFLLRNTYFKRGYNLRYYQGEILFRNSLNEKWTILWKGSE